MSRKNRRLSFAAISLALAAIVAVPLVTRARTEETAGMVFGTPRAEIFEDHSGGPLVEGDAVTFLPNVAPLKAGNRTHNVRLDIVAQEIEIANGVRYQAWTFGCIPEFSFHTFNRDRFISVYQTALRLINFCL